jgi:hypothetical protein
MGAHLMTAEDLAVHKRDRQRLMGELAYSLKRHIEKTDYGNGLTCVCLSGCIVTWPGPPETTVIIEIPSSDTEGAWGGLVKGKDIATPPADVRVNKDRRLQIRIADEFVSPEVAAARLLEPMFELIAASR